MTIDDYFGDWSKVLDLKEADRLMRYLSASSYIICPEPKNIFKAFRLCSLHNLRVVILGMDPFNNLRNNRPVATGIAFANSPDTPETFYSPSLEVLRESVIDFTKPHGITTFDVSLEEWEKQGVLLLNSALSCIAGKPDSHTLLWRPFMKSLLTNLSVYAPGTIYVLMGSTAESYEPYIDKKLNHILKSRHPAWYARTHTRMPSDIWREVNNILFGQTGQKIEWYTEY